MDCELRFLRSVIQFNPCHANACGTYLAATVRPSGYTTAVDAGLRDAGASHRPIPASQREDIAKRQQENRRE